MPHPFKNLTEANDAFAALTSTHEALSAELMGAKSARDTFSADLETARASGATAIGERDAFKGQVETLTAEVGVLKPRAEKVEKDFAEFKAGETQRFNGMLCAELAKAGHKALAIPGDNEPTGEAGKTTLSARQKVAGGIKLK